MLRFLKYIFLVFGLLALGILGFFAFQNRVDLKIVWAAKDTLSFEAASKECPQKTYECFKKSFQNYSSKVSLTGLSIGLKFAFNFLEELKEEKQEDHGDILSSLRYLEINNIVISEMSKRFHGLELFYPAYISKMEDFLENSKTFSQDIFIGLTRSEDGLESVKDEALQQSLRNRMLDIRNEYDERVKKVEEFIESSKEKLQKQS